MNEDNADNVILDDYEDLNYDDDDDRDEDDYKVNDYINVHFAIAKSVQGPFFSPEHYNIFI